MTDPQDSDQCCRCGRDYSDHELVQPGPGQRAGRRCPPARFTPLELPELEPTPCTEVVAHSIARAITHARGLHVLHTALGIWEDYVAAELAKEGRPGVDMEELIREDREALTDLLHGLL